MIAAANTMHEAGIRKAAILLASLDQAVAERLLDQLSPPHAALVRQAMTDIDQIDAEERQRVIDEFRRIESLVPTQCPPGIDLDGPVATHVKRTTPHEADPLRHDPSPPIGEPPVGPVFLSAPGQGNTHPATPVGGNSDGPPFAFLHAAEEEKLSQLLGSERPQTIALVLSHLPPERAGAILARLAPTLQLEVVRRLVDLDGADPETLREVEQALEARLSRQFAIERQRAAGPETVAKILAACDRSVAGSILDNLAEHDGPLAERLGRRPVAFDDLDQFDDAVLEAVFRTAEPEVTLAALLGAPPQLVERVLRRMVPKEARLLRGKLDCPGPIRLSDVEDARQQIAALAERIARTHPPRTTLAA